jgi:hypothetical protein
MKINKTKMIAGIILAITFFFPFRYAFILGLYPGAKSLLNFLFVLIGYLMFAILMHNANENTQ